MFIFYISSIPFYIMFYFIFLKFYFIFKLYKIVLVLCGILKAHLRSLSSNSITSVISVSIYHG